MLLRMLLIPVILLMAMSANAQTLSTYKIYTKTGKHVNYGKMVKSLSKAELIFIGEDHNNPISHWLEMKVIRSVNKMGPLTIGLEMFETDTQKSLNTYLDGSQTVEEFLENARPWSNYDTDYAPIVEFAKTKKINVIASNIPRRYASMVYKQGFGVVETLVEEEKQWIAPLPIPYDASLPGYVEIVNMMAGHGGDNLPKSQAIKDATMANSIVLNWPASGKFVHVNGSYHSKNYEGILWYIDQYKPGTKMMTITTVVQSNIDALGAEHIGTADFILVVDKDVSTSY